jgi:hypothetical protein
VVIDCDDGLAGGFVTRQARDGTWTGHVRNPCHWVFPYHTEKPEASRPHRPTQAGIASSRFGSG